MPGLLVHALHDERGQFNRSSLGAISEAARLAPELGGEVAVAVVGQVADGDCTRLGEFGADRVFRAPALADGLAEPVVDLLDRLASEHGYEHLILGGGLVGLEAGAGIAARRGIGITVEVTRLRIDDGELVATRAVLDDTALADVGFRGGAGVVVGRVGAFATSEQPGRRAELIDVEVPGSPQASRVRMVRRGESRGRRIAIEDAEILVAAGRGVGDAESVDLCRELADALGGEVAVTRAVVDAGWYPYSAQVGQTGKVVAPRLYLAAGVSGATQHRIGIESAELIVAINRDRRAPIFDFCDLGIVGDLRRILPRLTAAIRSRRER